MHRGVRDFVRWVEEHRSDEGISLCSPANAKDLQAIEHQVGSPLPADLRLVLGRFNGCITPAGTLLTAAPGPGSTIEAALKEIAKTTESSFLDPDLYLPFHRTEHGTFLAFDRSAAPVADTWPVVDFDPEAGEARLVHRTFDGWCRVCVSEWTSKDYGTEFSVEKYLGQGVRHAEVEPDVSIAHVTVGHALRRAGEPDRALASYRRSARCVPAVPWADWEALKLAAIKGDRAAVLESGMRLTKRAPADMWALRGTTPSRVAYLLARIARGVAPEQRGPWVRAVDHVLTHTLDAEDDAAARAIRNALEDHSPIPLPHPPQPTAVPDPGSPEAWWEAVRAAYAAGSLRDDDLALDPSYDPLRAAGYDLYEVLSIRRDFS